MRLPPVDNSISKPPSGHRLRRHRLTTATNPPEFLHDPEPIAIVLFHPLSSIRGNTQLPQGRPHFYDEIADEQKEIPHAP